ncbi:hypothetical protein [Pedobacter cryophilus]|uniref:Uncharacterized protein n=1 Tax=Pedobacter cryophilus TaxID=2571271 RepID=A0A4V5NZG9_9SPHI|nr:hypothetical protein [Pedobacter cryophilus]TKB97030.1 hypothetical protein FA046_13255 [Pedobacter cryophilus]
MKNTYLLIFLFSICYQNLNAQNKAFENSYAHYKIDFNESKNSTNPNQFDDNKLDSIYKIDKNFEFEFRLWTRGGIPEIKRVFIMTLKNHKWSAKYFDWNWEIKDEFKLKEVLLNEGDLKLLWNQVGYRHELTQIPIQESFAHLLKNYMINSKNPEFYSISHIQPLHGPIINFELLMPDKKKFLEFNSPQALFKTFSNVEPLLHVSSIISIVEKYVENNTIK